MKKSTKPKHEEIKKPKQKKFTTTHSLLNPPPHQHKNLIGVKVFFSQITFLNWLTGELQNSRSVQRGIKSWYQSSSDRAWLKQPWYCRTLNTEQGGCYFFLCAAEFTLILLKTEDCTSQRTLIESSTKSLPAHIYYFNASIWNLGSPQMQKKPDVPDCSSNISLSKNVF